MDCDVQRSVHYFFPLLVVRLAGLLATTTSSVLAAGLMELLRFFLARFMSPMFFLILFAAWEEAARLLFGVFCFGVAAMTSGSAWESFTFFAFLAGEGSASLSGNLLPRFKVGFTSTYLTTETS